MINGLLDLHRTFDKQVHQVRDNSTLQNKEKAKFVPIRVSTDHRFPLTPATIGKKTHVISPIRCCVRWCEERAVEAVATSPPWVANVRQVCVLSSKPWIIL